MFGGGVNRFIAATVAGLGIDSGPFAAAAESRGWRRLHVRPSAAALRGLDQAAMHRRTPQGDARVAWKSDSSDAAQLNFVLNVTVPGATTAEVRLPLLQLPAIVSLAGCDMACTETGHTVLAEADTACGIHTCEVRRHDNEPHLLLTVGPGDHTFVRH
jgi:hypothetical protein